MEQAPGVHAAYQMQLHWELDQGLPAHFARHLSLILIISNYQHLSGIQQDDNCVFYVNPAGVVSVSWYRHPSQLFLS